MTSKFANIYSIIVASFRR